MIWQPSLSRPTDVAATSTRLQTDGSVGTGLDTRPEFSQRSIFWPASVFHSEPSVVSMFTRRIFMSAPRINNQVDCNWLPNKNSACVSSQFLMSSSFSKWPAPCDQGERARRRCCYADKIGDPSHDVLRIMHCSATPSPKSPLLLLLSDHFFPLLFQEIRLCLRNLI